MKTGKLKTAGLLALGLALGYSYASAQYGQSASPSSDPSASSADQPSSVQSPSNGVDQGATGNSSTMGNSGSMGAGSMGGSPAAGASVTGMSDREMAGKVRRAIYDDKSLKSASHNVKVRASNGRVELKGRVGSQQDKDSIFNKAADIVGSDKIDNNLEVK